MYSTSTLGPLSDYYFSSQVLTDFNPPVFETWSTPSSGPRSFWTGTKTRWLQPEVLQLLYIYSQRKTSSRTETWRMKLCGKKSAATHQHGNFMHCENMQNENEKFKKMLCGMPFVTQPTLCAVATCCLRHLILMASVTLIFSKMRQLSPAAIGLPWHVC